MRKWIKILSIIFTLLLVIVLGALHIFLPLQESNSEIEKYFNEKNIEVIVHEILFHENKTRYLETKSIGEDSGNLVIFVHGAPGSSSDFKSFLADSILLEKTTMISVDRLGYGYSQYGMSETSLSMQASFINFIVQRYSYNKLILVGHSYGGPIVAKFAMEYPSKVDEIIMLAPLNDPNTEPIHKIGYLAKWSITRWLLPKAIGVSADEKFSHIYELEKMQDEWKTIVTPTIHIHGKKDILAPFSNIEFSKNNIPSDLLEVVELNDANHFLPWSHYDLVKSSLLKCLD